MPIAFSIATVFLFAGPHNWFEARYILGRLPAQAGKLWGFFTLSIRRHRRPDGRRSRTSPPTCGTRGSAFDSETLYALLGHGVPPLDRDARLDALADESAIRRRLGLAAHVSTHCRRVAAAIRPQLGARLPPSTHGPLAARSRACAVRARPGVPHITPAYWSCRSCSFLLFWQLHGAPTLPGDDPVTARHPSNMPATGS